MGFLDDILGALGSALQGVAAALAAIFNILVAVANFIWGVLVQLAQWALSGLQAVGKFFEHIWTNFFKGIFTKIFDGIVKLSRFLESKLRPIINFLKEAQKYIDRIYRQYVRPIVIALQKVRQVLSILRALHIGWAQKLDSILAQVQHDIQSTFLTIRGVLNTAIDLLNIVADPSKLLRRPTLILSLRRSVMALVRQVTHMPPGYFMPSSSPSAPVGLGKVGHLFDPSDPNQNPPASYYLGFDMGVPSYDFLGEGEVIGDGAVDDVGALDFFDFDVLSDLDCIDPAQCLDDAIQALIDDQE